MRKLLSLLAVLLTSFGFTAWAQTMPFEAAESADADDAQMYYIYEPDHQLYVKVSNDNILGNGFSGDQFIFVKSADADLFYIYNKSCGKYVTYTSTTDPGNSVKSSAQSAVQLVSSQSSAKTWRFVKEGSGDTYDIFPGEATSYTANSDAASWNFRGGKAYALNLYAASDRSSSWQIVAQLSAKLNCATRLFAEPGAKFMHKLVGNNKDDVESVTGLPGGFTINEDRPGYKYITGTAPTTPGDYNYTLNLSDGTQQLVEFTVSDKLTQPRPFMGVLTWNAFQNHIDENVIIKLAEGFDNFALKDAGYTYMCIDDQWAQRNRDDSGHLQWNTTKFPNYRTLADRIHAMDLKIGIYSDAGSLTCSNAQPGSYNYETTDANDFLDWGFDLLKYDFCNATGGTTAANAEAAYKAMGDALKSAAAAKGKDFLFYMCEWGYRSPWLWGANTGATCWRATDDTRDYWSHPNGGVLQVLNKMKGIWAFQGVNRWNDADMMCIGLHGSGYSSNNNSALGYGDGDSRCTGLTMAEQRSQMALWCMFASPLTHSNNITNLDGKPNTLTGKSVTNPHFREDLAIILNKELIALDQDRLGQAGEPIYDEADYIVFQKDMEDGSIGLSITNLSGAEKTITVDFARLSALKSGVTYKMRDLWSHEYVGRDYTNAYQLTVSVPSHDTFVYRIQDVNDDDLTWEEPTIPGWEGLENPEPEPKPEAVTYLTAPQIREKAANGRFAILGVTTTGDHYVNGAVTGHVSTGGTLAGVREPNVDEIVYFVSAGNNQYYIQREDTKKYFQIAAGGDINLVDDASNATSFTVYGKDETGYATGAFDDLFSDLTKAYNDYMIRFKANDQWLNTRSTSEVGGLRIGTGAWSFQYVRYLGEQGGSSVDPETPVEGEWVTEFPKMSTDEDVQLYYIHNIGADGSNGEKGNDVYLALENENDALVGKYVSTRDEASQFYFLEDGNGGIYIVEMESQAYISYSANEKGDVSWANGGSITKNPIVIIPPFGSQDEPKAWKIVQDESVNDRYDILPNEATANYGWSFMGGVDRAWVRLNLEEKNNRNAKWVFERQGNGSATPDEDNFVIANSTTGSRNNQGGNYFSVWTRNDAPVITLTAQANNMNYNSDGCLQLHKGTAGNGYTIAAPEGYVITGYSATISSNDGNVVTPTGLSAVTATTTGAALNVTGLNAQTATFNITGQNTPVKFADFKIYYKQVPATPVDPEINLGAVDVDGSKYPFILSTSADDLHWHYLTIRGDKYVSYNANTQQFDNSTTAPSGDAGLFAFVPVSENTVKIINKALGTSKAIGGTVVSDGIASVVDYASGLEFIYQNNDGHDVFAIKNADPKAHVNDIKGQLGFWVADQSATDAGSTFVFAPTEVLVSTDAVKHYYTIRCANPDKSRNTHYAHYAGSNAKLALNANRDNSTVFYFTSAGANEGNFQKVQIHNYTADGLTMNGWDNWAATNPMTWYVRPATGTTDILMDFNIANTMTNIDGDQNACWNYQDGGVFKWKAGNDKGSAWYLEEVKERTYSISIVGADDDSYTLYNNGEAYTNGDEITGFFFAANNFTTDPEGQHPFDGVLTTEDGTLVFSFNEYNTVNGGNRPADISEYALWYNEPATKTGVSDQWMEYALPMGNGQLGATIVGGVMTDKIQLNEKTLWSGGPGRNGSYGYFQNLGNIYVQNLSDAFTASSAVKPVNDYARYLDIMNGVAGVNFSSNNGSQYTRRYFTSMTDNVLVARYEVSGDDRLNLLFTYAPDALIGASAVTYTANEAYFNGGGNRNTAYVNYDSRFRVLSDGQVTRTDEGIKVENGTYATLLMATATDYDATKADVRSGVSKDELSQQVVARIEAAAGKDYADLLKAHTAKQQSYMGRVDFNVGGTSTKTTKELVDLYNTGNNKNTAEGLYLEQLYFQYGRYLTVGANADQSIHAPSNLQGIWNDRSNSSFWHCDVHADINVEMNYWPADPTNLSEMHLPFLEHIIDMATPDHWGTLTNGKPGWTIDCENNIFGGTSGWMNGGMKTLGAWYCSHLWRYYQYTKDKTFLKRALPAMYNNALYLKAISVRDTDNKWVIPNEWSPEHGSNERGSTITAFAQQTTAEVCDEVIKAHKILGSDSPYSDVDIKVIADYYDELDKGIQIENYTFTRNGQRYENVPCISEWKKYTLNDDGHRHLSHLMAIYPFEQISAYDETTQGKANFQAAKNGILARTGDVTGWSMGWQTNVYARTLEGDNARSYLSQALKHSRAYNIQMSNYGGCYYNLFDAHSPFQIDGNYGCTSGVAEMLVQSYDGKVHLLPALPNAWADGHAKGLKAIGNFTVDQEWAGGVLTGADVTSNVGGKLEVVYNGKKATIENTRRGETYHFDIKNGQLDFNLVDASIVTITDYIDGARSGAPYDADVLKQYEDLILKLQK